MSALPGNFTYRPWSKNESRCCNRHTQNASFVFQANKLYINFCMYSEIILFAGYEEIFSKQQNTQLIKIVSASAYDTEGENHVMK